MSAYIEVAEVSPNRTVSGHIGCIVSDQANEDCREPVVVFPHVERESNLFPHAVICSHHLDEAFAAVANGEALSGGEPGGDPIEAEAVEEPDEAELLI